MEKFESLKNRDSSKVVGGLILVAVGAALLLRNTGFGLPYWLFTWPVILILAGVYTGFKHNFRNNSWLVLIAVGSFFLVRKFIPQLGLQPYFWPVVIIGAGIFFILRPRWSSRTNFQFESSKQPWNTDAPHAVSSTVIPTASEPTDLLFVSSIFSGVKRNIVSKNFQGGKVSAVFGGAEIDLTQADLNGTAILQFEVLFGGAKIIVPSHWTIQNEIDGVFHGVDDNRRLNPNATINPDKILILKGSATFGGIDIRSYA